MRLSRSKSATRKVGLDMQRFPVQTINRLHTLALKGFDASVPHHSGMQSTKAASVVLDYIQDCSGKKKKSQSAADLDSDFFYTPSQVCRHRAVQVRLGGWDGGPQVFKSSNLYLRYVESANSLAVLVKGRIFHLRASRNVHRTHSTLVSINRVVPVFSS